VRFLSKDRGLARQAGQLAPWCLLLLLTGKAGYALDFQSSRTLSLGQTGRGGALLTDTIQLNPSLLGFQSAFALSGTYNWFSSTASPQSSNNRTLNAAVIDGKNEYVSAGLSYTRRIDLDMIHVGLGKRVLPWLSIGATAKRFNTRSNSVAVEGRQVADFEGGVSTSVALPKETVGLPIQFGATLDNIRHLAGHEAYIGPRQAGVGTKVTVNNMLMLYADYVRSFSRIKGDYNEYHGGAELALGSEFYARGGLFGKNQSGFSYGVGWVGPKIGVNYGFQYQKELADRARVHAITVDLYM